MTVAEANVNLASRIQTTASVTGLIMINDDDDGGDKVGDRTSILCLRPTVESLEMSIAQNGYMYPTAVT